MMNDILVDVRDLSIIIDTFRGPLRIIRNQDIMLRKGEILGVVGESGCGKSVMVNSLMGLLPEGRTKIKSEKFEINGEKFYVSYAEGKGNFFDRLNKIAIDKYREK